MKKSIMSFIMLSLIVANVMAAPIPPVLYEYMSPMVCNDDGTVCEPEKGKEYGSLAMQNYICAFEFIENIGIMNFRNVRDDLTTDEIVDAIKETHRILLDGIDPDIKLGVFRTVHALVKNLRIHPIESQQERPDVHYSDVFIGYTIAFIDKINKRRSDVDGGQKARIGGEYLR